VARIHSKVTAVDGIEFHSQTEAEYYIYLRDNKDKLGIIEIELQPHFPLLNKFNVPCNRCRGLGKKPSPITGNPIKCKRCDGTGTTEKNPWSYTADFRVTYEEGYKEVIDVKGYASEKFPLYRKLFEYTYGTELVVIKKEKGKWVRK
jgi:DnaJ-class molecular chaperone